MFGLEFLKRIVSSKATKPLILHPVRISDFATQYPTLSDLSQSRVWFNNPIKKTVTQAIMEFMNAHPVGTQFTANELRRYVNVYATPAPGSTDRILRDLRNRGFIGYILVDRRKSLYETTPVRVTVPDATGDSITEGDATPYFNQQAIEAEESDSIYEEDWANEGGSIYDPYAEML